MSRIGFDRKDDLGLHDFYTKKLLIPGWSGEVSDAEAQYIAGELSKSAKLRQAWGVRQFFGKRWKRISPDMAKGQANTGQIGSTEGLRGRLNA